MAARNEAFAAVARTLRGRQGMRKRADQDWGERERRRRVLGKQVRSRDFGVGMDDAHMRMNPLPATAQSIFRT